MAEYIDRDAAIEWLEANKQVYDRENKILTADQDAIIEWLKRQPAADVALVVYAHWIDTGKYACGETEYECSNCHETEWRTDYTRMKWCMFCGAKMDEVVGNETT